jgi:cytochrome c-type biogenesis protein CcmH
MMAARRWGPWLVLVAVVIGALFVGVHRTSHPTLEQRTLSIAGKVRCPVCEGESAAQSDTAQSLGIRQTIKVDLRRGESEQQILDSLASYYGEAILESPPTSGFALWAWITPVVVSVVAVIGLVVAFLRWQPDGRGRRRGSWRGADRADGAAGSGPEGGHRGPDTAGRGPEPAGGWKAEVADELAVRQALQVARRGPGSSGDST